MKSSDLLKERKASHSTAILYDAARRLGLGIGLKGLAPLTAGRRLFAPASTVKFASRDQSTANGLNLYDAIASVPSGNVLVLEVGVDCWICGANISRFAELSGLAGMVFDGSIRDITDVKPRTFPIFARGTSVRGYAEELALESVGKAIMCGGVPISPGDIVAGDDDGVVCFPADKQDEMFFEAEELAQLDEKLGRDIEARRPIEELHETRLQWPVRRAE